MKWYQLYVKGPEGRNTPQNMKRVDELLGRVCAAFFNAPESIPLQETDGTYGVTVFEEASLSMAKQVLIDRYGLEIVREVENE